MKITSKQKKKLETIGRKHHLKLLLLHGSYATGKQHSHSDLDIAYLNQSNRQFTSFKQHTSLHHDLADLFRDNHKNELDLKSLHKIDPLFMHEVAHNSQLLYGTHYDYVDFKLHATARYEDNRSIFELESSQINKTQQRLNKKL